MKKKLRAAILLAVMILNIFAVSMTAYAAEEPVLNSRMI